jgi:hypothetical protein
MKAKLGWAAALVAVASLGMAAPKGTVPRSSAGKYALHATREKFSIGVVTLSPEQARKQFVSDVNRCCVVVEVALYPSKDGKLDVSLNDLVLRQNNSEVGDKPASAKVIASKLRKKAEATRDISVYPSVGVGYGNGGYDPATGTRAPGGTYKQVGVGVGIGGSGPQPGSTDKDRVAMETELSEKGLPEGAASAPVAGYVYFPMARKKSQTLTLEYSVNGEKVQLRLPQ